MNLEKWSACIATVFCLSNIVFAQWSPKEGPLMTPWGEQLDANQVHQEYPRPQLVRPEWINLNGVWEYAITDAMADEPGSYDGEIMVPFPVESALSGVMKRVLPDDMVWYRRTFTVPEDWGDRRVLLHFGAVDWESRVWVNGRKAGDHRGGFDAFSFDITDLLNPEGENELLVAVWDPTDLGTQGRGKQVLNPGGIMYTAVTGIWQTVWLEPVPEVSIASLRIVPDIDEEAVSVRALTRPNDASARVEVVVRDASGRRAGRAEGPASDAVTVALPDAKLWSPDEPYLYQLDIQLVVDGAVQDEVGSYFGMRKISLGKDEKGLTRIFLNNEFVFQVGPLDQGWWPDGLYTAPSDAALRYDLEMTKKLGFNMLRKHVKVEPARLYYWADRLGLLVWQDMPSGDRGIGGNDPDIRRTGQSARQYYLELKAMIDGLYNHPSIIMWVPFNEGWGQFDTEEVVEYIQNYDPTRLVNNASGWTDRGVGDVNDVHRYPGPGAPEPEADRAAVLGEFGGLGLPLEGHTWQSSANWGYVSFQNSEELTDAYVDLFQAMQPLIHEGLSAAVYTQTTDVEVEVNGLMTYDRKVVKMDPARVALANRGYVPPSFGDTPDIFIDSARVVLNPPISGGEIRYTLDGTTPDAASPVYTRPIVLNATANVSARTFWPDGTASETVSRSFSKVKPVPGVELANPKPGLNYAVFEGPFRALPAFEILDAVETGVADRVSMDIAGRPENFALAFEGFFRVDKDDAFTFFLNSDDGTRMWIDGEKIIENDGVHGMIEVSGSVALKAGYHPIRIEYFQGVGGSGLIFDVATSGSGRTSVSPDALFHR
jgi:hypothetical protein